MIDEKLSRRENEIMNAVFRLSGGQERFLISPYEISAMLPSKASYTEEELERTLQALEMDGYFDFVLSERKGDKTYVIHMRAAGLAFARTDSRRKRGMYFRWGVGAIGAVITFLVGLLLKALFS